MLEQKMNTIKMPDDAVVRVEEMQGGVVVSVEIDGRLIYTMAYDQETDSYGELYDRNDKRAQQVHHDLMGWQLLH